MRATRVRDQPAHPVWVMEDAPRAVRDGSWQAGPVVRDGSWQAGLVVRDGSWQAGPAAAIAGRLGVPVRRIAPGAAEDRVTPGRHPALIVSSGWRAAARALLLKARHGSAVVHCRHGALGLPDRLLPGPFDLLVLPATEGQAAAWPPSRQPGWPASRRTGRVIRTLGLSQPVSPGMLVQARLLWSDRLAHLPWPRIAVLLGPGAPGRREASILARRVAAIARARGGCVLASVLPGCPAPVADGFAAGLRGGMHLLFHAGEPGPDPTRAFLGGADSIVVAWAGAQALSEACAAEGPVFVLETAQAGRRGLAAQLLAAGLVRAWPDEASPRAPAPGPQDILAPWARPALDESGRVAAAILRRFGGLADRSLEPDLRGRA